ncbi:MAG: ATP synthase F1 subunit epsilon [Dictyoglomaceae bacterium]
MNKRLLHLELATPDKIIFKGEVSYIVVPVEDGMWGILPGHINTLAHLTIGVMKVVSSDKKVHYFAIGEGFLEIVNNNVYITVDSGEKAEDIDVLKVRKEKEELEQLLAQKKAISQRVQLYTSLQKALAKLRAVESLEETKGSKEQ